MTTLEIVLLGFAGGVLPDILRIVKSRYDGPPTYLRTGYFWFCLALLACLGGLATYLAKPSALVEAIAVGFSAPEILSKLFGKTGDRSGSKNFIANLRAWWAV
jgi:hypothetical protein